MKVSGARTATTNEAFSAAQDNPGDTVAAGDGVVHRSAANSRPLVSLLDLPAEILVKITQELNVYDALAMAQVCSTLSGIYSPELIASLLFEKNCLELIQTSEPGDREKNVDLKKAYRQVLSKLIDPGTGLNELKRMAGLAGKFYRFLPQKDIRIQLSIVLSQQAPHNLQAQLEKLAKINLGLCMSLCCAVRFTQLVRHGVTSRDFILDRFSQERGLSEKFLRSMEKAGHNSALHRAAFEGSLPVVSALLEANPESINLPDDKGTTPLLYAIHAGEEAIVLLLLAYQADVNQSDAVLGRTPLMRVAYTSQHERIAQALLQHGASIEQRDNRGHTALMFACEVGHGGMVQLLLEHGAEVDTKADDGMDALSLAQANGHEDVVQLLKSYQQNATA